MDDLELLSRLGGVEKPKVTEVDLKDLSNSELVKECNRFYGYFDTKVAGIISYFTFSRKLSDMQRLVLIKFLEEMRL